jgi:PAS domain S-box-containing protein
MAENLEMKVKNLELLLRVKSLILKAKSIDKLLSQLCNSLIEFQAYDVSWAVLNDGFSSETTRYISDNALSTDINTYCWQSVIKTSELYIFPRDSKRCETCALSKDIDASTLSKRLEHKGTVFGVFAISVRNYLLDEGLKNQFIDLVADLSMAIHLFRLKAEKEQFQNELNESRHMYRELVEFYSLPVGIIDNDYRVTYMSNSLKKMLDYSIGNNSIAEQNIDVREYIAEGFSFVFDGFFQEVLLEGKSKTGSVILKTFDNRQIQVQIEATLLRNILGDSIGFMMVFQDLSSDNMTEKELRLSEEKYRRLFMKAPHGASLLSPSGVIIDCNERDAEMLQMSRSEILGKHVKSFLTKKYQQSFERNFEEFERSGTKEITVKLKRKDGTEIYVSRSVSAYIKEDGSLGSIIVHSRDVTEEVEAQNQIKLLQAAIEQSTSVFTISDLKGNITYVNRRFTELTGYSIDEVLGKNPRFLKSNKLPNSVYVDLWDKLKNEGTWQGELLNKKKNGELYWEAASLTAIRNTEGELANYLKVAEDVTQRKIADKALEESTIRYHNIFNLVPNPIVIHSYGNIVDVNQAALFFSKKPNMQSLIGMSVFDFVHESSKELIKKRVEKLIREGGEVPVIDAIYVNSLGEKRNVRSISKEVSFKGKRAFMVVFEDVTDVKIAEQKVLDSEQKFRNIFNLHPDPVTIADIDSGELYEVNDAFLKVVGKERDEVIGVSSYDIDIFDDPKVRENIVNRVKAEGSVLNHEISFTINNHELTALVSGTLFGGAKSKQILFVARDITKIKNVEHALIDSNTRYRNVFNMAPNPIIIHINGVIVDVNRAALLFSGAKKRDDLLEKAIWSFIHESSKKEILNQIRVLNRGAKILPFDALFLTLNGEKRDVRTSSNIISFGGKQAYMVFFEDITERKSADKKLVDSEKRFRQFFDLIPDPVILTNMINGVFIEFNRAAVAKTGLSKNELFGKSVLEYGLFRSEKQRDILLSKIRKERVIINEELVFNINNTVSTMLVSGRIIEPYEEQNVLWIARDITKRKKMEQDLIKAKERAETNDKLKSSFLSNMSHEIRTPMNAILGFSDLLRDSQVDENQRNQYINIIQQRGTDLLKMMSDIMDLSKIESNTLDLVMHAVKIYDLSMDVVASAKDKLDKYPNKNVELNYHCGIKEDVLLSGDKYRIRQVLNDLLDNAIKFTKQGSVSLRCWQEGPQIVFEIVDTGIGIGADKMDSVFDPFVQVHDEKDISVGGAGLGLSLAKSLLKMMRSDLTVLSTFGYGTKMRFSLPLYDGNGAEVTLKVKPKAKIIKDWSGKTFLIAEDEPSNQMFMNVILAKTGVEIIMANDGREALDLFIENQDRIALVLVDVRMPKMNGYELAKELKKLNSDIVVIALTANAMNNDREEALSAGCNDYLTKPISKELLLNTIDKYL